jgi:branched-chain amino acid transport system substrate-binding protein
MGDLKWATPQGEKTMRAGDHQAIQPMYVVRVNGGKFNIAGEIGGDEAIGADECKRF